MSNQLYSLIMATVPEFYSGNEGEFQIPKDRFLQYTEDPIKEQFQSLDQDAIKTLKSLPAIFATEQEVTDARIGKITDVKVSSNNLRVKYKFDEDRYPLTRGALKENRHKLGIRESGYEFHRGHWGIKECDLSDFYAGYLKSLTGIAHQLKNTDKKAQLIYAFNGTGKTRLSRALKNIIAFKSDDADEAEPSRRKFLYYNAFTEDLFYWDNDLEADVEPKLKIQPNSFTAWILKDQGQDRNIISNFQHYANDKLTPTFNEEYKVKGEDGKETVVPAFSEVTFSLERGDDTASGKIKISKGEESNFIWSIFYALLDQVITILNVADPAERETDQFDQLEYVFIDDPVCSLDENHLIELAVNLATLIKSSKSDLKFILTTHSPLFYNILSNEFQSDDKNTGYKAKMFEKYRLDKQEDGTHELEKQANDSPFSYHLYLMSEVRNAIKSGQLKKYHFNFLRHILEKTSTFLGHKRWEHILPVTNEGTPDAYVARILNISSHSKHSGEEISDLTDDDKRVLGYLVKHITDTYGYWKPKEENNG